MFSDLPTQNISWDPSCFTTWGVYLGMQAAAQKLWESLSLIGKIILNRGLGNVCDKLANILFSEGAELAVEEVNLQRAKKKPFFMLLILLSIQEGF